MQSIIEKYEKILEKPMSEPFKGYIEELLSHIKGNQASAQVPSKPKAKSYSAPQNPLAGYEGTPIVNP